MSEMKPKGFRLYYFFLRFFIILFLLFRYIFFQIKNNLLSSERAAFSKLGLATGWGAKNVRARTASDDSLGVGEDGCDSEASWALDVHEEGSWSRDESLELVLLSFSLRGRVEKILSQNLYILRKPGVRIMLCLE